MNQMLVDLLSDEETVDTLRKGLPFALQVADVRATRMRLNKDTVLAEPGIGQEVGITRERILQAFLINKLGENSVVLPHAGASMVDISVGGYPLEIKSVTDTDPKPPENPPKKPKPESAMRPVRGEVTAKWTADTQSVAKVMEDFEFESDMLLVRLWWGHERDSLFYIPVEVLREQGAEFDRLVDDNKIYAPTRRPKNNFLSSQTGTNNRGVKLKSTFMQMAEKHSCTSKVAIDWERSEAHIDSPLVEYRRYWVEGKFGC